MTLVGFGTAINYLDLEGKKTSKFFESSVIFYDLCSDFSDRFQIHFINFAYNTDYCGNITVQFIVQLCPKNIPDDSSVEIQT